MCGLVGVAGKIGTLEKDIFKDLLQVCQVRGRDSTGVVFVKANDEVAWAKQVGPPTYLIDSRAYDRAENGPTKVIIGHTRAKTVGLNTVKNAHPFDFSTVIGVHNGTLKNDWGGENRRDFDVDSEWLYHLIDKYGVDNAIPMIEGAYALTFWNKETKELNFLRNNERSLYITYSKDLKTVFWASESWMFSAVSRKIDLWDGGADKTVSFALGVNQLMQLSIDWSGTKPQEIFSLKPSLEVKQKEVRGYAGNNYTNGAGGTNKASGGSVSSPFVGEDKLDDKLPIHLLPGPVTTKTVEEFGTTNTPMTPSVKNTQNSLASSTALTSSLPTSRAKLSLVESNSGDSAQGDNANTSKGSPASCGNFRKPLPPLVSKRKLAGLWYITDNKTSQEISEKEFETLTQGICCFCQTGIGGLEEIEQLFINNRGGHKSAFFTCSSCSDPIPASKQA